MTINVVCDAIKQKESELAEKNHHSLHLHCMLQFQTYIMLKPPIKIEHMVPEIYSHFNDAHNKTIQRKWNAVIGSI